MTFVIGPAEGLPEELVTGRHANLPRISLGQMTLTHNFARALLAEQIYRAEQIWKGTGYNK